MKKRFVSLAAALCLALSLFTTANAASYFPAYTGGSPSISAALDALGVDSSYANRTKIAAANGGCFRQLPGNGSLRGTAR